MIRTMHNDLRFMRKTEVSDGCWKWIGGLKSKDGYGEFSIKSKSIMAYRYAYMMMYGHIPDGYEIDHLCKNRICVNPEHLEAVTPHENWLRGDTPSSLNLRKTKCKRGHSLTGRNVMTYYFNGSARRSCRECANYRRREWRKAKKTIV